MVQSGRANSECRSARDFYRNLIALVDVWRTNFCGALDFRVDPDTRYVRLLALVEAADLPFAGRTLRLGVYWTAMVKCIMGDATSGDQSNHKTACPAIAIVSF